MSISTQMLLSFDPKVSPRFQADVKNAYRTLAEEINRKAAKPFLVTATFEETSTDAAVIELQTKLAALVTALNQ